MQRGAGVEGAEGIEVEVEVEVEKALRALVRARAAAGEHVELAHDLPLGAGGLGLDSIALAELLLECERRFGLPAAALLAGPPLTIGRLVAHLPTAPSR